MKRKSSSEIAKEALTLLDIGLQVSGDTRWLIDAQVDALVYNQSKGDVIFLCYNGDISDHQRDAALEAIAWRDNDDARIDRPSQNWLKVLGNG